MTKRSRRIWFIAALAGLVVLAVLATSMGDRAATTLRQMHGQPR